MGQDKAAMGDAGREHAGPSAAAATDASEMSVEEMLEMQRKLASRLQEMGIQQQDGVGERSAQSRKRFEAYVEALCFHEEKEEQYEESLRPPRARVGQLYEVVYSKPVAVRMAPSLEASAFRALAPGSKVELFEWDHTRNWRRVTMMRALEPDAWQPATTIVAEEESDMVVDESKRSLGPIARVQPEAKVKRKLQVAVESQGGGWKETDGWVLTQHPEYGPLLQLCSPTADEEEEEQQQQRQQQQQQQQQVEESGLPADPSSPEAAAPEPRRPPIVEEAPAAAAPAPLDPEALWDAAWAGVADGTAAAGGLPTGPFLAPRHNAVDPFAAERAAEQAALASVEDRPGLQEPGIMRATRAGAYIVVKSLLARGVSPNLADAMGETALFEAVVAGRTDLVAVLLLAGANPAATAISGATPRSVSEDGAIRALLDRWEGFAADPQQLRTALSRLDPGDAKLVAERCGVDLGKLQAEPQEGGAGGAGAAAAAAASEAAAQGEAAAPAAPAAPCMPPTRYRVVYKKVVVREQPDVKSRKLRQKVAGDVVEMFDWDASKAWRRIRVVANPDGGPLKEMDGWMMVRSDTLGDLLQEEEEPPVDEDDSEDDGAG